MKYSKFATFNRIVDTKTNEITGNHCVHFCIVCTYLSVSIGEDSKNLTLNSASNAMCVTNHLSGCTYTIPRDSQ